jgi:hypothetical protein
MKKTSIGDGGKPIGFNKIKSLKMKSPEGEGFHIPKLKNNYS